MMKLVLVVCCFLALKAVEAQYRYNCLTSACQNGACEAANNFVNCFDSVTPSPGVCPATFYNYDCGSTLDQELNCNGPGQQCDGGNAWACSGSTCICKENYYKSTTETTCLKQRIWATCNADTMDVYVAPYELEDFDATYSATIIQLNRISSFAELATCAFTADITEMQLGSAGTDIPVWSLKGLSYDTDATPANCLQAETDTAATGPTTTHTASFLIKYANDALSGANIRFDVVCTDGIIDAVIDVQGDTTTSNALTETFTDTLPHGVTWRIAESGTPATAVSTAIDVNTEIAAVIDLDTTHANGAIDIGLIELKVTNYPPDLPNGPVTTPANEKQAILYENGCPLRLYGRLLGGTTKIQTGTTVTIQANFKAFTFNVQADPYDAATDSGNYPLGTTWISLKICLGNPCHRATGTTDSQTCEQLNTANANDAYISGDGFADTLLVAVGRKKRQAEDNLIPDSIDASMQVLVLPPNTPVTIYKDHEGVADDDKDCHQSLAFLIPIILLAVMLLVAMGMAFFFCMKLSRSDNFQHQANVNMACKS